MVSNKDDERAALVGLVTLQREGVREHLGYVVEYLHDNLPFIDMLRHAKNLSVTNRTPREYVDPNELVAKLTEQDLPIVKNYILALNAYLTGMPFESVMKAARELSFSKPMPDTIYAPPGTFSKELIEAYEQV